MSLSVDMAGWVEVETIPKIRIVVCTHIFGVGRRSR
jgi:hypothetical protein